MGSDGKPIALPPVTTLTIPDSEAKAYEQRLRTAGDFKRGDGSAGDLSGEINAEFSDPPGGLARVNGAKRTSMIVDPADGRIPYIATEEERKKFRVPTFSREPAKRKPTLLRSSCNWPDHTRSRRRQRLQMAD